MSNSRPTTAEKRQTFRKLHEAGCFVIPNPWNVGTARYLQGLGFKALATTSAGHAHSLGFPDGGQSVDAVLAHYRELADATDVPLNADFENGFADDPDGVAANVTRCIATGVAGLSVEDSPKDARPLYELDAAVARVKAARAAVDRAGGDVVFTARAENFIRGVPDLDDVIRRLKAYAAAVALHDGLGDGQPQSRAAFGVSGGLRELSEDPVLELDHRRSRLIVHGHPHPRRAVNRIVRRHRQQHSE